MRYSTAILDTMLRVPINEIDDLDALKRSMTLTNRWHPDVKVELWQQNGKYFGIPLYWYPHLETIAEKLVDRRIGGKRIAFDFKSDWWPGQREVVDRFRQFVSCGSTGILFEAPAGFGKTVTMLRMIHELACTALVVVPRSNLVEQWVSRIRQHTNIRPTEIGFAEGGRVAWKGTKIVVGLVHTLALDRFGEDFKQYFGAVFFDEVDRSVPPQTFAPVVAMFPSKYRIGASATMVRTDGMDRVMDSHIGQVRLKGPDSNRMRPTVLIVDYKGKSAPIWPGLGTLQARGSILSKLAENSVRNMLVAKYTQLIYNSDRRVLVLSDRTRQLAIIRDLLHGRFGIPYGEMGFYCRTIPVKTKKGDWSRKKHQVVSEAVRAQTASACKIILATYGMFAIGSDIPDLAGLVYATPQSETIQSKGRIERVVEGKRSPVLVDIVDWCYPQAIGWGKKRVKEYDQAKLRIKRIVENG